MPRLALLAAALAFAAPSPAAAQGWYAKAVKGVTAAVEPAEARPGQTVTFTLTVELNEGYFTYPLSQPEKAAAGFVNTLTFPAPSADVPVVFVGTARDADKLPTKAEPDLGVTALRYCPGKVTYTRTAVVSPAATPGAVTVSPASFKMSVCDATNCFPAKAVTAAATLKVLPGPPVPVAKEYADEVAKALAGK